MIDWAAIVATLVEAIHLRNYARWNRAAGNRFWARAGYRMARNRLARLRAGEVEPTCWDPKVQP